MYQEMVQEEMSGKRPMFRPKGFMTKERRLAKLKKLKLLRKGGQEEGVLAKDQLEICSSAGEIISKIIIEMCEKFKD